MKKIGSSSFGYNPMITFNTEETTKYYFLPCIFFVLWTLLKKKKRFFLLPKFCQDSVWINDLEHLIYHESSFCHDLIQSTTDGDENSQELIYCFVLISFNSVFTKIHLPAVHIHLTWNMTDGILLSLRSGGLRLCPQRKSMKSRLLLERFYLAWRLLENSERRSISSGLCFLSAFLSGRVPDSVRVPAFGWRQSSQLLMVWPESKELPSKCRVGSQ